MCVGREWRSQPGGGLTVDRQRRLLPGLRAAEQLRQLPAGPPRRADGGGEAATVCALSCISTTAAGGSMHIQTDAGTEMIRLDFFRLTFLVFDL